MSESVVRVPAKLRRESRRDDCYPALKRRLPTLVLSVYGGGVLEQVVILKRGRPCVLTVEDETPQQENPHE